MEIVVPHRVNDSFFDTLFHTLDLLIQVNRAKEGDEICINLSNCSFSSPFILLPIYALINNAKKKIRIEANCVDALFANYLNLIKFPAGLDPLLVSEEELKWIMQPYIGKTYIPLIKMPTTRNDAQSKKCRNVFLSIIQEHLSTRLSLSGTIKTAICYIIDELVANIVDHSGETVGFIFTQFYPANNYMDLCIIDNGISILGSYERLGTKIVITDLEAMEKAANGESTKGIDDGRGYGLKTSRRMLADGLNGKYFLLSGSAALHRTIEGEEIVDLQKTGCRWDGTMLAMRIPTMPNPTFIPDKYYE